MNPLWTMLPSTLVSLKPRGNGRVARLAGLAGFAVLLAAICWPGDARAQLPAGTWQYAWGDDFSGSAVDTGKWNIASPDWTMPNSNSTASADKVSVGDGVLTLDATRTGTSGTVQFSSGSVSTYQKHNFNGGYIEARIWLPDTPGSWPAFWGLYDGWPPECDIMEYPIDTAAGDGYAQDQYHTAFHYVNSSGGNSAGAGQVNPSGVGDLGGAWHTFAVNWVEDTSVTFYFDGQQVSSFNSAADVAEMAHMYLILDYAVGGWPGTPNTTEWPVGFTDQTKVDWVRVWKSAAAKTSNWVNTGASEYMTWDTAANWTNGVPNLGGVTSNFGTVTPAAQRIDWSGSRMLSVLNLDGGTRYRFGWPDDRLVLGYGDSGAIQPSINLAASTTSEQEIYGELEWSGDLNINNDSPQPLLLTGVLRGGSGININGPGIVSFDGNNNTYSGATVIDSGSAGPGVARARGQNSLGLGGPVVIGQQGNATTARLELENGALVSNPIHLNGRNNDSAGIVNNSGVNTISGTVSSQAGGDRYWIRSDAGQLVLSGADGGGVAIDSGATGTRNFTLRGAGDGVVDGIIANGNATVSLTKADAGTWTLEASNTYSGTTTVAGGTLEVNGSTGTGATTVNSGATLGGSGTVRSSLTALSGSTVRAGHDGFPLLSPSSFAVIDDFETYPLGDIGAIPNTTGDKWIGVFNGTGNADIVNVSGDKALQVNGINSNPNGWRGAITDLGNRSLPHGQTGTYFFRVRAANTSTSDYIFGLTDQAASTSNGTSDVDTPWDEYAVTLSIAGGNLRAYSQGSGDVVVTPIASNTWLNVWVVVNNAAKTFQVATSSGTNDGALSGGTYNFGRRAAATNSLVTFGAYEHNNVFGYIDDLHFASGSDLTYPYAAAVPTAGILNVESHFTLASGATLEVDLHDEALHNRLVVGGQFNASGTLRVAFAPGAPTPAMGDSYDLFDNSGGTINFASYDLPALPEGLAWDSSAIGSGVLTVAADPTVYAGWALGQPFAEGTDGPLYDVEPDGIPNVFEWLFGGNPFASDTELLPHGQSRSVTGTEWLGADPAKQYLSMTATIRKDVTGMTLTPQAASSPELLNAPGSSDNIFTRQLNDLGDFEEREWIYTVPIEDAATGFMRLKLLAE